MEIGGEDQEVFVHCPRAPLQSVWRQKKNKKQNATKSQNRNQRKKKGKMDLLLLLFWNKESFKEKNKNILFLQFIQKTN